MDSIQQNLQVTFRYPVLFTAGLFAETNSLLREVITRDADRTPADVAAIVDRGVVDAHPDLLDHVQRYLNDHRDVLRLAGPILVVPGGEAVKNDMRHIDEILRVIQDAGLCRHSYVLAIGGGAVLDAVGYAAATAHRGVRLVRIPTTVLAQDDSAVGVKNGINAFGKKNYLGTFAPPYAVINDFNFLPTLIDRDWRGGIAEAVKAGLIRDAAFFDYIEQHAARLKDRDLAVMEQVVRRSAAIHLRAHRHRRRSVRARFVAAAGLRALGGAQAGAVDGLPDAPRRGGGDRHRPRYDLCVPLRLPRGTGLAAGDRGAARPAAWRCRRRSWASI